MVITSHMSDTSKVAVLVAHFRNPFSWFALLPALIWLVVPAAAWGDVYKWTDPKGITVFSDVLPKQGERVNNFEVVTKETRPATNSPTHVPAPTEQALLERIQTLERQQQVQQYLASVPVFPPPSPPPSSYYDSGYYDNGYDSGYYPSYYPSYGYPVVAAYSYPARTYVSRPVFAAPRGGSFRGGSGHSGGGHGGRR